MRRFNVSPVSVQVGRVAGALALTALLGGSLAGAAHAAPPLEPKPQCMTMGSISQCVGPSGITQQVGDISQSVGPDGVSQQTGIPAGQSLGPVQVGSMQMMSGGSGSVSVVGGGEGTVVSSSRVTTSGGSTTVVTSGTGGVVALPQLPFAASAPQPAVETMPALPTDVPLALAVSRGPDATYHKGETVYIGYAINQPMSVRIVSVQGDQTTTLMQGGGTGSKGMVSATAGPNTGPQTFKIVGLGEDLKLYETSVTITVVD